MFYVLPTPVVIGVVGASKQLGRLVLSVTLTVPDCRPLMFLMHVHAC
jgi:hypothetical protein